MGTPGKCARLSSFYHGHLRAHLMWGEKTFLYILFNEIRYDTRSASYYYLILPIISLDYGPDVPGHSPFISKFKS